MAVFPTSKSAERRTMFQALSECRGRPTIALVNSTKRPEPIFATQIALDVLPIFYELLRLEKLAPSVDLLVYSAGGQIDTPWPLMNLMREYYGEVHVLVPSRAHSVATLLCLGANTIGMSPLASLSPIDPQFEFKIGDKDQVSGGVEDVYGFYDLVLHTLELDPQGRADALKILTGRISPEALGKIGRTRREIRGIAVQMLGLHMEDPNRIEKIVSTLVEVLPSHQYMINRREATTIGLPVLPLTRDEEVLCFDILRSYQDESLMESPGVQVSVPDGQSATTEIAHRAFIETIDRSFVFQTEYVFQRDGKLQKKWEHWNEV